MNVMLLIFLAIFGYSLEIPLKNQISHPEILTTNEITVVIDEYIDRLFFYISSFAANNHLDPITIFNVTDVNQIASLDFHNGSLYGISTLQRTDNATLTYVHDNKSLSLELPVSLPELKFTYNYIINILGLHLEGIMTGTINKFKANVKLSFNFDTFQAKVEDINTFGIGVIELNFEGNDLDEVINILTNIVTTILHPIIEAIIDGLVNSAATGFVNAVNNFLDNILHPQHMIPY